MGFIKKNTVSSIVVVASSVYNCSKCDHTEMIKGDEIDEHRKCPKCENEMKIISSSAGANDEDDTTNNEEDTK